MTIDYKVLVREAIVARESSYSPYSNYMVGSALLAASGKVYRGCNIENAAYTPTNCAERTAFYLAVAAGERAFTAIAVAGWKKDGEPGYAFPCGVCRQVMLEFCDPKSFEVIVAAAEDNYKSFTLRELMPNSFGPGNLS